MQSDDHWVKTLHRITEPVANRVVHTESGIVYEGRQPEGRKDDNGKAPLSLIPTKFKAELGRVLLYGAKRYGERNWMQLENPRKRYIDAAMRHIDEYVSGERVDDESGLHPLAHAAASLAFIVAFDMGLDPELDVK